MLQHKLVSILVICWSCLSAVADPGTLLLNTGCSPYNASNVHDFNGVVNRTFSALRSQVSNERKHFATAQSSSGDPFYAMFQCRNYLSNADCLTCFNTAAAQIRNCSSGNGARVIYDGCFLRYESAAFFEQSPTGLGNNMFCENQTATEGTAFTANAEEVLKDLQVATPKIKGFYAATKAKLTGAVGNASIYAIAQCSETVSESLCLQCLQVGYNNIHHCLPRRGGRAFDAGCFMRYSVTRFFADNQTIDITPFLKQDDSSKKWAIIGGVAGGVALVLILLALFVWRRSKYPRRIPRGDILGATELKGPVNYRYRDLKAATSNFSEENKLGEGGFGDVYKGTLKNGKVVAVKRLVLGKSNQLDENFESEVKLISNVHHRNLVRLLGCCSKDEERILVYEYMANSSLDRFLFGERRGSLNWKQRCDIILGTLGYMAPEYAIHGQLSEKADTYSYGIVVLEIVSGQKSSEVKADDADGEFLLQRAWRLYERGMHIELVDNTLDPNEYDAENVKKVIEIALLCTQASAIARPTMSEVVVLLKSKGMLEHQQPTMPIFVDSNLKSRRDNSTSTTSSTSRDNASNRNASNATASISSISAR
ncbi:hypothetical protein L6164_033119 [Bauhinia variegata]|uniref:Uncharacterized protein n=1 Tax=Bauhinia variegata TaxID=167791 RepID=A0ACB9KR79_BAUVA|nr:hypothetical protein L6164_033119 [Bauhinia variegata]